MHYAYYVNIITMHYATVQIGLIQSKLWVHLCSRLAWLHPHLAKAPAPSVSQSSFSLSPKEIICTLTSPFWP